MAKRWKWSVVCIPLLTIFMYLASVVVGFCCFAVVRPFEITEIIWRSDTVESRLEIHSPCVSLKIIPHLRTFFSQSDSSIQRPRSIMCDALHKKSPSLPYTRIRAVFWLIHTIDWSYFLQVSFFTDLCCRTDLESKTVI